jgi:hypothetical protein
MAENTTSISLDSLLRRIERLEGQARRRRWLGTLGVLLVAAGWFLVPSPENAVHADANRKHRVVEAEKFVLRDAAGRRRAELALDEERPLLALFDAEDRVRCRLLVDAAGAGLAFYDEQERTRIALGQVKEEGAQLALFDGAEQANIGLKLNQDGAALLLTDEQGKPRASLTVNEQGSALGLRDEHGTMRAVARVQGDTAAFAARGENPDASAALVVADAVPTLTLEGEKGCPRIGLAVQGQTAHLALMDAEQRKRAMLGLHTSTVEFALADHEGTVRSRTQVEPAGVRLGLLGNDEKSLLGLSLLGNTPEILLSQNDKSQIGLQATERHTAILLRDAQGKARAGLGVNAIASKLELAGADEQVLIRLNAEPAEPAVQVADASGKPRAALKNTPAGPVLQCFHPNDRLGIELGLQEGGPALKLRDELEGTFFATPEAKPVPVLTVPPEVPQVLEESSSTTLGPDGESLKEGPADQVEAGQPAKEDAFDLEACLSEDDWFEKNRGSVGCISNEPCLQPPPVSVEEPAPVPSASGEVVLGLWRFECQEEEIVKTRGSTLSARVEKVQITPAKGSGEQREVCLPCRLELDFDSHTIRIKKEAPDE